MRMRQISGKLLSLVLLLTLTAANVNAADESYIQSAGGKLKKGDSLTVIDDKFLNLPLDQWNMIRNLSVNNFITFELRQDTNIYYYNKAFTCTLNVSIKYFSSRDQLTPTEINNISLVVKYDTATGKSYPVFDRYTFKNAYKVTVVINSITSPEWGNDLPAVFRIKNQILVQRKYPFSEKVNAVLGVKVASNESAGGNFASRVTPGTPADNYLTISWDQNDFTNFPGGFGAPEEYDVEWTYIDALNPDRAAPFANNTVTEAQVDGFMRFDNSRVTVTSNTYKIILAYADGYIVMRVRGAWFDDINNLRRTTDWQYRNASNQIAFVPVGFFEQNLNWQYTVSFAEEGKSKAVGSMFDGSLRNRQAVTITNSDNKAIIAETIYDNMGRPAVSILPAPTNDDKFKYYPSFNKNFSGDPYSHTDISAVTGANGCTVTAAGLNTSSGAAQYYSPNNAFISDPNYYFTKYVPDSRGQGADANKGYPFTLTEYMPDNTGRIRRQGGVGYDFRIGSGHETNYFYGKPLQSELDRLFGMEVGNASHYLKNMVIDPNGQISVSYVDAAGKTIATALAGKAPGNVDELASALAPEASKTMTQILMRPADFQANAGTLLKEASATFLAAVKNETFTVLYSANPASFGPWNGPGAGQQFCSNCYYDIEILVKDDCGNVLASTNTPAFQQNDVVCNANAQPFTGSLNFFVQKYGEHTITYRLRLSQDVIKTQTDYYITNNIDLKQLQWFFENELSQTDLLGCYSDCDACKKVGDLASFTVKAKAILQKIKDEKYPALKYPNFDINSAFINQWITNQYNAIVANCNIIAADCVPSPCEQKLEMMKYDVRPGGQYLLYDATYNIPASEASVTIINYTNGVLLNYKNDLVITNFEFTDENGVVHHIKDADVTVPQFIKAYLEHPEWADDFVKRHIEYCSYLWCKDVSNPTPAKNNEVSYKFDEKLKETVTKGSDAVSGGYYSQTDYLRLSEVDPFFNGGRGTSYKEQFQSDLENLSAVLRMRLKDLSNNDLPAKNIQEFVEWMLYCKPANENATAADFVNSWSCTPAANCRSLTGEWEMYRNYYLKIKSKYVRLAKLAYNPNCENCFIGQDPIASSTSCANPGPLSDYSFQTWIEPDLSGGLGFTIHYDLVYKEGTAAFRGDYNIVIWGNTFTSKKGDLKVKDVFLYGCSGFPYPCDPPYPALQSVTCAPVDPQLNCGDNGGGGGGTFTCPVLSDFNITQSTDGFGNNTIVVDYIGTQAPFPAGVTVSFSFNAEFTYGPDIISFNVANSTGDWIYVFPSNLLFVEYNTAAVNCSGISVSGSCPTPSFYSGSFGGSGFHLYPSQTIDASSTPVGTIITATCFAYDVPNRISIRDGGGNIVASTGWFGFANYSGPWGFSINTPTTQQITFTRSSYSNYSIEVETVTQGTSDAWEVNLSCNLVTGGGGGCPSAGNFTADYSTGCFSDGVRLKIKYTGTNPALPFPRNKRVSVTCLITTNTGSLTKTILINNYSGSGSTCVGGRGTTVLSVTITGVTCTDIPKPPASTCSNDPRAQLYTTKIRIWNEFVDEEGLLDCLQTNGPVDQTAIDNLSAANVAVMRQQAVYDLDALKLNWIDRLKAVRDEEFPALVNTSLSDPVIVNLVDNLYQVALKYIQIAPKTNIRPASTLPVAGDPGYPATVVASNGYNNFTQVFNAFIGPSLVQQGFGPHLLDNPYPYDKTPVLSNSNTGAINSEICAKVTALKNRWTAAGSPGTFHSYLQLELKEDYKLTQAELTDLETRCTNGCKLLNEPVLLPAVLAPSVPTNNNYNPWISCSDYNTIHFPAFQAFYPNVAAGTKLYRNLLANFMNARFGYAQAFDDYDDFKNTTCTANPNAALYAKPASPSMQFENDIVCTENILRNVFDKAGQEYELYVEVERRKFRNGYISKCLSANASAKLQGKQYEYHYTLYYYGQDGNLVKTIPPEGIALLTDAELQLVEDFRDADPSACTGAGVPATENATATFNALSSGLQSNAAKGTEMWLYSGATGTDRHIRVVTPDKKYLYQAAIHDNKLWVELYSMQKTAGPSGNDEITVTLTNEAVADLSALPPLQTWSHLQIQSATGLNGGALQLYLDGRKLTNMTGVLPGYPFAWEMISTGDLFTFPAQEIAVLKHFRIYDRTASDAEVLANYKNSCLSPVGALAVQSTPLQYWGRFNIPAPGSATTTGPGSTIEYVNRFIVPDHVLPTNYAYNSLNQVVKQSSPDGGTSEFFYDRLGRLTISQNEEQKTPKIVNGENPSNRYSYTRYDALGRITEVGEKLTASFNPTELDTRNDTWLTGWLNSGSNRQVTVTAYDAPPAWLSASLTGTQKNLRKRVTASALLSTAAPATDPSLNRIAASYYSYDLIGNVNTLVQENADLTTAEGQFIPGATGLKTMKYEYDLVSGKVNKVLYQDGKWDQFYYQYLYDADNRVVKALSSRNNYADANLWVSEAVYRYYLHGPLARMELGQNKVQGTDYAYTLQGWLKGVNSQVLDPNKDMSGDGLLGGTFSTVAKDVLGFGLGYFEGDYKAIENPAVPNTTNAFKLQYQPPSYDITGQIRSFETGKNLFNGNISNATYAIKQIDNGNTAGYSYRYDQLNRLTGMRRHTISAGAITWNNTNIIDAYKEEISFDANGNIKTYLRNGANLPAGTNGNPTALALQMDEIAYGYNVDNRGRLVNNKLRHVKDQVAPGNYTEDIDDQNDDNYRYDNIGNLISDNAEKIQRINWTVYGKIGHIYKDTRQRSEFMVIGTETDITYKYDAAGNRISKLVAKTNSTGGTPPETFVTNTFYVRDAQGNVMGVYQGIPSGGNQIGGIAWIEQHLYGSSRLGMVSPNLQIGGLVEEGGTPPPTNDLYNPTGDPVTNGVTGKRAYELSNHLGNVLVVINDIKIGFGDGHFEATVLSANDYYPFGMIQPGRKYTAGNAYRYGFNGKEKDDDVKGIEGSQQDYGMRIYDPRIGRFLSVDPLYRDFPWNSSYSYAENDVIQSIDLDGLEKVSLSGTVPKEQYYAGDGQNNAGRSHYTPTNIKFFKLQGERLRKQYGFEAYQVSTGKDIVNRLIDVTKAHGYVSHVAIFTHAGPTGFYLKNDEGFYTGNKDQPYSLLDANVKDIASNVAAGNIKFSKDATFFINGCNCADERQEYLGGNPNSIAGSLALELGVTVIAASGHMEMKDQKKADGTFVITDGGTFYKYTRVTESYTVKVKNDKYVWWNPFDKNPKYVEEKRTRNIIKKEDLGKEVKIDDYVK
jgi:RHS repeat-associated protein